MKVTFLKAWNGMPQGRTMDLGGGMAELLIARGVAVAAASSHKRGKQKRRETADSPPADSR